MSYNIIEVGPRLSSYDSVAKFLPVKPVIGHRVTPRWKDGPVRCHAAAMRKRVQIALAVLLLVISGKIAWQAQGPPEREPV